MGEYMYYCPCGYEMRHANKGYVLRHAEEHSNVCSMAWDSEILEMEMVV